MGHPRKGATQEKPAAIRGIWCDDDEPDEEWKGVVKQKRAYPWGESAGIPKFKTKEEASEFMKEHAYTTSDRKPEWQWKRGSNPEPGFEHMNHMFTMLVEWSQIEKYLLPKLDEYDWRFPSRKVKPLPKTNRYCVNSEDAGFDPAPEAKEVFKGIQDRLNLSFHRTMGRESTLNTLRYLFFHMRCGIFVSIRQQQVVLFVPFANKDYQNDWEGKLRIEQVGGSYIGTKDTLQAYYAAKSDPRTGVYREENILGKPSGWSWPWLLTSPFRLASSMGTQ